MLNDFLHRRLHAPYTLHVEELRRPRRPRKTVVCIHGIGSSTHMWHKVAEAMPSDVRVVAVDLLGFGKSPKPAWATYDASTQAASLVATLIRHRVPFGSLIVGHSLGGLVAVELARRFPVYATSLLLISPPIYKPSNGRIVATQREDVLRGIYKILQRYPKNTERGLRVAKRYYVKRAGVTDAPGIDVTAWLAALSASIVNQSTIDHIGDIKPPITLLSGSRDPLVVNKNLQDIAKSNPHITHTVVKKAGHNVVGVMRLAVEQELLQLLEGKVRLP